jgi:hypothetical protein
LERPDNVIQLILLCSRQTRPPKYFNRQRKTETDHWTNIHGWAELKQTAKDKLQKIVTAHPSNEIKSLDALGK